MSGDTNRPGGDRPIGRAVGRPDRFGARSLRERVELAGIAGVGALALAMLAFILLDWLRFAPDWAIVGPAAALLFEQFLIAGAWMDVYLGTNVFRHPFMWRVIATGVFVGIAAPLVGTYLVHRQMALIGETLAHTAFAGVAIGVLVVAFVGGTGLLPFGDGRTTLIFVAMVVSALGALGLQWLTDRTNTYGDVPIAIVLSGSFAVGTLLISWGEGRVSMGIDIMGFLFGSIAIVTVGGARMVAVLTLAVVAVVAITYKQLLFITFDEQAARVARLDVDRYNTLLIVMTAVVVVGAMQILGVILVAAMLVIPVATASQIATSFRETLFVSILLGQAAVLGGLAFGIWSSLPPGGSIVVVAIAFYLLAILLSDRSGVSISMH